MPPSTVEWRPLAKTDEVCNTAARLLKVSSSKEVMYLYRLSHCLSVCLSVRLDY